MSPNRSARRLRLLPLESRLAPAVATFRATATDVEIRQNEPAYSQPLANAVELQGPPGTRQVLIRFDELFGSGPEKIPAGADIVAASLTVWVEASSAGGDEVSLHRMLTPWDEAATWSGFGGDGVSLDNVEASSGADAQTLFSPAGFQIVGGLAPAIREWATGQANHGWVLVSDSASPWRLASREAAAAEFRPTLSVMYRTETPSGLSYTQLAGAPPSPLQMAWFDWADDLRQRRIDRAPSERTHTFFFSAQSGDDLTGTGTAAQPWRTLAKAQTILGQSAGDVRLRFRRGDVWIEDATLLVLRDEVTADDYGDPHLPQPRFTRFTRHYTTGWTAAGGLAYRRAESELVGWLREAGDGYSRIYYRAASAAEVTLRPYSWFHDTTGTDPLSGGQPSLFVNAGQNPNTFAGGLEACPGDGLGWEVASDNVRMQNLTLEGQGISPDGQSYGLKVVHQGAYWEFVGIGLSVYYTGYHAIGHIGQYQGTKPMATLVGCSAGYCVNRDGQNFLNSGDITVYVAYSDYGGTEYIQYDCEYFGGALPSADWVAPANGAHGQGLYTHVGPAGTLDLLIVQKSRYRAGPYPVRSLAQLDSAAAATSLDQVRAFIIEDPVAPAVSDWTKHRVAVINSTIDQTNPPPPYNLYQSVIFGGFGLGGWYINCTMTLDLRWQYNFDYNVLASPYPISTQFMNCHIDLFNSQRPTYFVPASLLPGGPASSTRLTNTIVSFQTTAPTGLNLSNTADHLRHNAYFLPQLRPEAQYHFTNDPGGVTLTGRLPAGVSPMSSGPLFDGGFANGLEYDARRQPRGPRHSIGPLTGVEVPAVTAITYTYGNRTVTLTDDARLPWATIRRFTLTYPAAVPLTADNLYLTDTAGRVVRFALVESAGPVVTAQLQADLPSGLYRLVAGGAVLRTFRVHVGDFDGNGAINFTDFLLFRTGFGTDQAEYDLDGDGTVNFLDFLRFRGNFGA